MRIYLKREMLLLVEVGEFWRVLWRLCLVTFKSSPLFFNPISYEQFIHTSLLELLTSESFDGGHLYWSTLLESLKVYTAKFTYFFKAIYLIKFRYIVDFQTQSLAIFLTKICIVDPLLSISQVIINCMSVRLEFLMCF